MQFQVSGVPPKADQRRRRPEKFTRLRRAASLIEKETGKLGSWDAGKRKEKALKVPNQPNQPNQLDQLNKLNELNKLNKPW